MDQNIDNISFEDISLDEYKEDIKNINNMFDNLMKDRKIKKAYKKIQKLKENEHKKISYNNIKNYSGFDLKVSKNKEIKIKNGSKNSEYIEEKQGIIYG